MALEGIGNANYTDLQGLQALRREARAQDPQALRETARQFESLFTRMMLKSMREASFGDELFDSNEGGFYRGMLDDQLAIELSRGRGLGLADVLIEQLKRAGAVTPQPEPTGGGQTPGAAQTARGPDPGAAGLAAVASTRSAHRSARDATGADSSERLRSEFVERLRPHAEAAASRLGVSASTLLAHAALETGWGRSMPRGADGRESFNLFGIKAGGRWQGAAANAATIEYEGGVAQRRVESFRAYGSIEESFADYVALLERSPRYAQALGTGRDAAAFGAALQRGGYATDPDYARKLAAVAERLEAGFGASLKAGNELPIPAARDVVIRS